MVYLDILDCICHHEEAQTLQQRISTINLSVYEDEALPLINGLHDLPFDETEGNYYMGGVGGGLGLCVFCTSNEDKPSIDGDDEHEAGPAVIVTAFSDDDDGEDDPVKMILMTGDVCMFDLSNEI
ncbi:hypothetical protein SCLCIDRAFT_127820 [Scleroderma citrinum Foug A]|uniref:Uncharacterized protein n=1 Tax=Scleroderma citrinum Foug A TaxID=1036808 RepID=A0A0C3A1W9_9AGAM|nr:hypothetical protein SCLCIDRAFT_127820 [Scleroderma citrinum Foug A]